MTISLYVPGTTALHRQPATRKLALLLAAGIALFLTSSVWLLGAAGAIAASLLLAARPPVRQVRQQLVGTALILAIVFTATAVLDGWRPAFVALLRLAALVLLAMAVTTTTRTSDMLEICERALSPLDRAGLVNAARVSLAVSLVLRFVPEILKHHRDIREAQAARGLRSRPAVIVVPLIVRTLRAADDVAEAVEARCYPPPRPGSDTPPPQERKTEA